MEAGEAGELAWQPVLSETGLLLREWAEPATSPERRGELSAALAERINNSGAEVKVVIGGEELVFVPHWWDEGNPFDRDFNLNSRASSWFMWGQWLPTAESDATYKVTPEYADRVIDDWSVVEAAKTVEGQHYRLDSATGEWVVVETTMTLPGFGEVDVVELARQIQQDPQGVMAILGEEVIKQALPAGGSDRAYFLNPEHPLTPLPAVVVAGFADRTRETVSVYHILAGDKSEDAIGDSNKRADPIVGNELRIPLVNAETGELWQWLVVHQGLWYQKYFIVRGQSVKYDLLLGRPDNNTFGAIPGEVGILLFSDDLLYNFNDHPLLEGQQGVGSLQELNQARELLGQGKDEEVVELLESLGLIVLYAPGAINNR